MQVVSDCCIVRNEKENYIQYILFAANPLFEASLQVRFVYKGIEVEGNSLRE